MKPKLTPAQRLIAAAMVFSLAWLNGYTQCTNNIALGKQASASSTMSGNNPGDATDGNGSTRWESASADPQHLDIDLGEFYNICRIELIWENASARDFTIQVSNDAVSWSTVGSVTNNAIYTNTFTLSTSGRYVRMSGTARTTGYGYSIYEFRVFGALASGLVCPAVNLANGQPGMASSVGNPSNSIANAFDNNTGTRWESMSLDPQWIYIDLGARYDVCNVMLNWENAYGRTFSIDFSNDALSWTTVKTISYNTSLINNIPLTGVARYVRMHGTVRATGFGYSLWEFQAFGSLNVLPVKLEYFRAVTEAKNIRLEWASQFEASSAAFEIQRSNAAQNGFVSIGRVKAAGNAQQHTTYQYTDATAPAGKSYYRLKQIDIDGSVSYSPVSSASLAANGEMYEVVKTVFNRSNNLLTFVNAGSNTSSVGVQVYNADGRLLITSNDLSKPISMASYSSGVYLVLVKAEGRSFTTRILR